MWQPFLTVSINMASNDQGLISEQKDDDLFIRAFQLTFQFTASFLQ
jgi:hypothetical protein